MEKHIILSLGRSGSNYLVTLLNAHPQVTNYGEVLGEWMLPYQLHHRFGLGGKSISSYLEYIYDSQLFFYLGQVYSAFSHTRKREKINFKLRSQVKTVGVKDFSINFRRRDAWSFLKDHEDILVINLYRENLLKRYISLEKMSQSGVVAIRDNEVKEAQSQSKRIHLSPGKTLAKLEFFETALAEHMGLVGDLAPDRVLNVRYEDLFENPDAQSFYRDQIFSFLHVDPMPIKSGHRKITSDELSNVIENYEEVHSALSQTRFAQYLNS
ncbi:MAG: hypothetical protein ACFBSC_02120 [Microcoleaceae cyanobacterium]